MCTGNKNLHFLTLKYVTVLAQSYWTLFSCTLCFTRTATCFCGMMYDPYRSPHAWLSSLVCPLQPGRLLHFLLRCGRVGLVYKDIKHPNVRKPTGPSPFLPKHLTFTMTLVNSLSHSHVPMIFQQLCSQTVSPFHSTHWCLLKQFATQFDELLSEIRMLEIDTHTDL